MPTIQLSTSVIIAAMFAFILVDDTPAAPPGQPGPSTIASSIQYSQNGERLLICGYRESRRGPGARAFIDDAATFQQLFHAPQPDDRLLYSNATRFISDRNDRFIITVGSQVRIRNQSWWRTDGGYFGQELGEVKIWDGHRFHLIRELKYHPRREEIDDATISPDGTTLVTVCTTDVNVWGLETGEKLTSLRGHRSLQVEPGMPPAWKDSIVKSVAFSPSGKILVTGGYDLRIRFWDVAKQYAELNSLECGQSKRIPEKLVYSPDGTRLVSANSDATVSVWDTTAMKPCHTLALKKQAYWGPDVAVSPDGKSIATADRTEVRLWDMDSGKPLRTMKLPYAGPACVAYSPCGRYLAIGFNPIPDKEGSKHVIQWDLVADKLRQPAK